MGEMNETSNVSQSSTLQETDKKCPKCGGVMDFDPNIGAMACPYCGYEEEIVQDAAASAAEKPKTVTGELKRSRLSVKAAVRKPSMMRLMSQTNVRIADPTRLWRRVTRILSLPAVLFLLP